MSDSRIRALEQAAARGEPGAAEALARAQERRGVCVSDCDEECGCGASEEGALSAGRHRVADHYGPCEVCRAPACGLCGGKVSREAPCLACTPALVEARQRLDAECRKRYGLDIPAAADFGTYRDDRRRANILRATWTTVDGSRWGLETEIRD